jgi:histidinol-phosphatase (PHP family)
MSFADMHVHTLFSCDSRAPVEAYCEEAARRLDGGADPNEPGSAPIVDCFCFTDHVDCNRRDIGCDFYDCEGFFKSFNSAQAEYGGRLKLLTGIEFAEPHLYQREYERHARLPYDFIMGSIHFWYNDLFASEMLREDMAVADSYKLYWEEVAKAVRCGGFDALAHMDFPKRYYRELYFERDVIRDIFAEMLKNNIILEINTSSLRKGLDETMPGDDLLLLYKEAGGRYITTGSDAHSPEELGAGFPIAAVEQFGFVPVKFVQRKMVAVG